MGLPRDLRVFGEMVQQAAAAGSADALFALGGVFFHGEDGFARDPRAAFRCATQLWCFSLAPSILVSDRPQYSSMRPCLHNVE